MRVDRSTWTQVQLTLPVGTSFIYVDAVSGIDEQTVNYIALDDVTIDPGNCSQPGNSVHLLS